MGLASVGSLTKFAIAATGTAIASYTNCMEFLTNTIAKQGSVLENEGIRGTRSHNAGRVRNNIYTAGGQLTMQPTRVELATIVQYLTGDTATPYTLEETIGSFDMLIDKIAKRFVYGGCKIVRGEFTGSEGSPLGVALQIEALTETASAVSFPAISPSTSQPFIFTDLALTIGGATYQPKELAIAVENIADTARFLNSVSRTEIPIIDRLVTVRALLPYTSTEMGLYDTGTDYAVVAVFTNSSSGDILNFTFPAVRFPAIGQVISGKGEIMLELAGTARMSGANREVTIDVTH